MITWRDFKGLGLDDGRMWRVKQAVRGDSAISSGDVAVRAVRWSRSEAPQCERKFARRICLHTQKMRDGPGKPRSSVESVARVPLDSAHTWAMPCRCSAPQSSRPGRLCTVCPASCHGQRYRVRTARSRSRPRTYRPGIARTPCCHSCASHLGCCINTKGCTFSNQ